MATKKINFNGVVDDIGANAQNVDYSNANQQDVSNVKGALDKIFAGGLVERNLTSRNIFNPADAINNAAYGGNPNADLWIDDTTGAVTTSTGNGCRLIGVPVEGGQTYCYRLPNHDRCDKTRTSYSGIHCYDSNGTYIKKIGQYPCCEGGYMFTVPDNCALIKFVTKFHQTNYESMLRNEFMLERGSVVHDYEPYNAKYLAGVNGNKVGAKHPDEPELMLPYNIAFFGDSIMGENQGLWFSHFRDKYSAKSCVNYGVGMSRFKHELDTTYPPDITASNAREQNHRIANQAYAYIYQVKNAKTLPEPDIIVIHGGINDRESGDSAIANPTDAQYLERTTDYKIPALVVTKNNGVVTNVEVTKGSNYVTDVEVTKDNGVVTDVSLVVKDIIHETYGNPQLVFWYDKYPHDGTPKLGTGTPFFQKDANNIPIMNKGIHQSLVGGIRYTVELLKTEFPNAKVVMTTPLYVTYSGWSNQHQVRHINAIIKECASYMSVPVIDLTYELNLNPLSGEKYLIDGLHPTIAGARLIADFVARKLMSWYGKCQKDYDTKWYRFAGVVQNSSGTPFANTTFILVRDDTTKFTITTNGNGEFDGVMWNGQKAFDSLPASSYLLRRNHDQTYSDALYWFTVNKNKTDWVLTAQ